MRLQGIRLGTTAEAMARLGLDVVDGRAGVGGVTVEASPGEGIVALDLVGAPEDGPLPLAAVECAADGVHPIGATAVDHVVVVAGDVRGAIADLGTEPRRIEERDGRVYGFVLAETAVLEFVGPTEVEDRPPRLWGLALTVADLEAAAALLGDACSVPRDAVQPGRRIVTVRHDEIGLGVPTVLLSPRA